MRKIGEFLKAASTVEPYLLDIGDEENGPITFADPRDLTADDADELATRNSVKFTYQQLLSVDDYKRAWPTLGKMKNRELRAILDDVTDHFRDHEIEES
ncbi:hypothetical protein ACWEOE_28900 [Amycolatopsis sp. NPDC004368]